MHLESLAMGVVQAIKHRSPAPSGSGWPINSEANAPQMYVCKKVKVMMSSSSKVI
jgi:hypothetical protein